MQATVTTDKYLFEAWDIDKFPLNVADGETVAPKHELVFQESSKSKGFLIDQWSCSIYLKCFIEMLHR